MLLVLVMLSYHLTCAYPLCPCCTPHSEKQTLSQYCGYTTRRSKWQSGREVMSVERDCVVVSVPVRAACLDANQ